MSVIKLTELLPEEYIINESDGFDYTWMPFLNWMAGLSNDSDIDKIRYRFLIAYDAYSDKLLSETPPEKRQQVSRVLNSVITPFRTATTIQDLKIAIKKIESKHKRVVAVVNKHNKFKLSRIISKIKSSGDAVSEWWDSNKNEILTIIVELLIRLVIEVVFAILRAVLKTNSLKAPKISFRGSGGFGSGGGGSSGKW
jgi:hypothetical protein